MKHSRQQNGAATIMFTIFMVVIISLLAMGFAFLVRNDQRASLDKTLSNQAQYASESAVNKIAAMFRDTPRTITDESYNYSSGDCSGKPSTGGATLTPQLTLDNSTQITCLKWGGADSSTISFTGVSASPVSSPVDPTSVAINRFDITWSSSSSGVSGTYPYNTGVNVALPNPLIPGGSPKIPIIKLVLAKNSMAGVTSPLIAYLVPTVSAFAGTGSMSQTGNVIYGRCDATNTCKVQVTGFGPFNSGAGNGGLIALSTMGGSANISATARTGATPATFKGSQVNISATSRSQDVIKRLDVKISTQPTTWHPGFAVSADQLCKNFIVDASGNNSPGPAGVLCPN